MSKEKTLADQAPVFRFLDRSADIEMTSRILPHWFQVGAALFVTFRTADSLPKEVILRFQRELEVWLQRQDLPLELASSSSYEASKVATVVPNCIKGKNNWDNCGNIENGESCRLPAPHRIPDKPTSRQEIPREKLDEFKKLRARAWHQSLDQCHGACLLRQPKLARIVAESILFYNNNRYDLDRFVIMPNHVHAIVQFRQGSSLETISQTWLRYTARQINFETGEKGRFWQPEPFDHIIRNEKQFSYLQQYIADNPAKAKLNDGEYLYWQTDQTA